jgi:hypothetical protein
MAERPPAETGTVGVTAVDEEGVWIVAIGQETGSGDASPGVVRMLRGLLAAAVPSHQR